jgi:signal transduction histidine kinase
MHRNNFYVFIFSDDGKGFNINKQEDKGIGIMNIESRVQSMHGTLNIESKIGEGTLYTIRIPVV